MAPRLPSGSLIVARPVDDATRLRVGDVVVARRPDRPDLEIVQRMQAIDRGGAIFLGGDTAVGPGSPPPHPGGSGVALRAAPADPALARRRFGEGAAGAFQPRQDG